MNTRWHSLLFLLPVFMLAGVAVWVVGLERERAEVAVRAELVALAGREAERWENEAFSFFGKMPPDFVARIPAECFDAGWCPELNIPDAEQLAQWADLSGKLQQAREAKDAMADSQNSEAGVGILREMLKHPAIGDARSAAGLPMLQIVLRNLLDADRSADRMAVAIQLAAEAFKEPTPISGRLIEDAADAIFGGFPQSMRVLWTKKRGILEMLADGDEVIEHGCRFPSPRLDWDGTHRSTSSGVGRWSKEFPWIEIGSIWWFADFSLNDGFASIVSLDEVESEIFRRRNQVLRELPGEVIGVQLRYRWNGHIVRDQLQSQPDSVLASAKNGALEVFVFPEPGESWRRPINDRALAMAKKAGAGWGIVSCALLGVWLVYRKHMKLAALQADFIASVSHELRTPVAGISALAERLEAGKVTDEADLRQYHRFIAREGRRLAALIDNVLDFSRIEQDRKQYVFRPLDYSKLVSEVVALLRGHAEEKGVRLVEDVRVNEDSTVPNGDAVAMRQVLVNLLGNAIKFTPSGGMVTVLLEPVGTAGLRLAVTDTGPGIAGGEIKRIFDRFYRADNGLTRETTGAGIGLSIVKAIVEAHGGTVSARNERGGGATFEVLLGKWRATA